MSDTPMPTINKVWRCVTSGQNMMISMRWSNYCTECCFFIAMPGWIMQDDLTGDWFESLERCFRWSDRAEQKPFTDHPTADSIPVASAPNMPAAVSVTMTKWKIYPGPHDFFLKLNIEAQIVNIFNNYRFSPQLGNRWSWRNEEWLTKDWRRVGTTVSTGGTAAKTTCSRARSEWAWSENSNISGQIY